MQSTTDNLRRRRLARRFGFWLGMAMLTAAVIYVGVHRDDVLIALGELRSPSPVMILLLLVGIVGNLVLSGLMFSVLIRSFGRVGLLEMQALTASITLINYLPLRPGVLGRIAYHHHVNRIRATHTLRVLIESSVLSVLLTLLLAVSLLLHRALGGELIAWIAVPVPVLALLTISSESRRIALAGLIRWCEIMLWAMRYYACFYLIGVEIGFETAAAFACVSVIATMIPLVSNGLGLREWAIGLAAASLTQRTAAMGVTAELVNRAAELLIVTIAGLISSAFLTGGLRGVSKEESGMEG